MRRRKPQPLLRFAHDLYGSLAVRFRPPLQFAADPTAVPASERITLVPVGQADLAHPLESALHGQDFAATQLMHPAMTLVRLQDVLLTGDQGVVFLADGRVLGLCASQRTQSVRKIRRPIPALARRISGRVVHLTGRNHENHGHFLVEHLPRLFAAREWLRGKPFRVLVAPGHRRWQSRYLSLLGVPESDVIEGSPGTIRVEELIYVSQPGEADTLGSPDLLRRP